MQCAAYACGLLGRITGEKWAVCSTCPEQRGVLLYSTWPNDQVRIEHLSSCSVLGCSEHSQQPDYIRASTFCQFELILSILITSICWNLLMEVYSWRWSSYRNCSLVSIAQEKYFFFFFPKADSVGAFACKLQNDQFFFSLSGTEGDAANFMLI